MIDIILPDKWNLLQDLNDTILSDLCKRIFWTRNFNKKYENRRNWRYIKAYRKDDDEMHIVCFSNPNNDARNAVLMQFISPSYIEYDKCINKKKNFDIYLLRPWKNDKTNYIKLFYRCFLTLWINVLQLKELWFSDIKPFTDYYDLKEFRNINRGYNRANESTYFTDDDYQISFYWKTFWANAMESTLLALTLTKITNKKIVFYNVFDNDSQKISEKQENLLKKNWISFWENIFELKNDWIDLKQDEKSLRDTPKFHYNLLKKFWDKRCYLCGCNLEHMIIGSHIERVTDITHSNKYSDKEKIERIVDWDNGLWLCANHDKLFEYWMIYFEWNKLKISPTIEKENLSKEFINKSISDFRNLYFWEDWNWEFTINLEDFNDKMNEYLKLHHSRIYGSM